MKRLILCLGNEIAGDDGVGLYIGKRIKGNIRGWDVKLSNKSGFYLLEEMEGYREVIIVDSIILREGKVGEIIEGELSPSSHPFPSPHLLSLPQALSLGRRLGLFLPTRVRFLAIAIAPPSFGEGLSEKVLKAAELAIAKLSNL